jgi:alpha-amylase
VFGGLYMPHLREAVYRHLSLGTQIVQSSCPAPDVQMVTLLGPQGSDVRLRSGELDLFLSPQVGGALIGLEDRRFDWNLQNTLRRRREAYHTAMERAPVVDVLPDPADESGGEGSIHDLAWPVTPAILAAIRQDPQPRWSLLERFLHPGTVAAEVLDGMADVDGGDIAAGRFELLSPRFGETGSLDDARFRCTRTGCYRAPDGAGHPLAVLKEITPRPEVDGFRARWEIRNSGDAPMSCRFGVEWNLALFDGGVRRLEAGEETALDAAELPPADRLHLRIPLHGADLIWQQSEAAAVWARPVRAATQGEDGFHLTYQGHLLVFVTDLELAPGEVKRFAQEFRIERAI